MTALYGKIYSAAFLDLYSRYRLFAVCITSCDARWYSNHDYHTMYMAEIEKVLVKE